MYSQNNEEQIILEHFGLVGKNFVVLDIGANDGITFSNSKKLIELGWKAHLVEPSPKAFSKLSELHKFNDNVHLYNVGLLHTDSTAYLFESESLINENDVALVSSYSVKETEKWKKSNVKYGKVPTKILSFQSFIEISQETKFDLITIDIEGYEMVVLEQIDLNKYFVKMLILEWNGNESVKKSMVDYCSAYGIGLFSENAENLIFKR